MWSGMLPRDFDATARDQPLTLFAEPDPTGTLDLFSTGDDSE